MKVLKFSSPTRVGVLAGVGAVSLLTFAVFAGATGGVSLPTSDDPYLLSTNNVTSCSGGNFPLDGQLNAALGSSLDLSGDTGITNSGSGSADGFVVNVSGGAMTVTIPAGVTVDFIVVKGGSAASGGGANVYWGNSIPSSSYIPPSELGFSHWLICFHASSATTTTSTTTTTTAPTTTTSTTSTTTTSTTTTTTAPTTTTTAPATTTTAPATTTTAPATTTTAPPVVTTVVVLPPTVPSTLPPVTVPVNAPGTGMGGLAHSTDNGGILAASGVTLLAGLVGLGLVLHRRRRA